MKSSDEAESNPFATPKSDLEADRETRPIEDLWLAPFSLRVVAAFMDVVIVETIVIVLFMVSGIGLGLIIMLAMSLTMQRDSQEPQEADLVLAWLALILLLAMLCVPILYGILSECSASGATIGKQMARLKVVDLTGRRVSFGASVVRNLIVIKTGRQSGTRLTDEETATS